MAYSLRTASQQSAAFLLLAVVYMSLNLHTSSASSLTFNLPYGQRKCFREEIASAATARGTIHVASGRGEMSLDLFVSDSRGKVYFHKSDVNTVKFSFRSGGRAGEMTEEYQFCVVNQVHPQAAATPDVARRVTLQIDVISERHSVEMSRLAKQTHADKIYSSFSTVSTEVDSLIERMDDLRVREQKLTDLNEHTATAILRISLVACLFTVATGMVNFLYLKSFFKRKKLA